MAGTPFGTIVWSGAQAVLTVCIQIAIGFAMAKSGIVTPTVSRALSLIVFRALIPALLFSAVGRAIDVETFKDLLLSPVMAVVLVAVGAAIAGLLLVVLRVPQRERGIVVAMGSFGNSLFLPLALFSSLAKNSPFDDDDEAEARGVAITSLFVVPIAVLMWSLGVGCLAPPDNVDDIEWPDKNSGSERGSAASSSGASLDTINAPIVDDASERIIPTSRLKTALCINSEGQECDWGTSRCPRVMRTVNHAINPPVLATFAAIILALIPFTQRLLFDKEDGDHGELVFITDTLASIGAGALPLAMLILGSGLAEASRSASTFLKVITKRSLVGVVLTRFVLGPLAGVAIVVALIELDWLDPTDKVLTMILLLQTSTPPAQTLVIISQLHSFGEAAAAAVIFWTYVLSLPFIVVTTIFFLSVVETYADGGTILGSGLESGSGGIS